MSILIESGEGFYDIPDDVLAKCKISKAQFEKGLKKISGDVEGQGSNRGHIKVGAACTCDHKSLWASCL